MKSKILSVILAVLLVFTLTACSDKNNQNPPASSPSSSVTGSGSDTGTTPEPGPTPVGPDNSHTPTIYLAGDSTVKTYENGQYIAGWGQYLSLFLDSEVTVKNAAHGGRSSRSFINEGRLYNVDDPDFKYTFSQNGGKSIEDCITEGDFLFIQFGHNDDDTKKASSYSTMYDRMTPLGTPDANGIYPTTPATKSTTATLPEAYTKLATAAEESAALTEIAKYGSEYYAYGSGTYKWYLKQYIDFARRVGATPVLVTPVARVKFSGGAIIGGQGLHGENFAYVTAVRQLAEEENCLLIDLFADSKTMLETATQTYANYLMALKPNDLTGAWPSGYDGAYGNAQAGYTGIEATHYNKYGAFLQAARVAEAILSNTTETAQGERFNFSDHILVAPSAYIDPSNLIAKTAVQKIEGLFSKVTVTNPERIYPSPQAVIDAINALSEKGAVTAENHLNLQEIVKEIRSAYNMLNVDDRPQVTNLATLVEYENAIEQMIKDLRPVPTKVVIFNADNLALASYTETVTENGFTLIATADKKMDKKSKKVTFSYGGVTYNMTNGLSVGGSAKFGQYRYVSFDVEAPCTVTIAVQSSGADARTLKMVDASGAQVGSFEAGTSVTLTSVDLVNAGTYQVGSAGSGMYIYVIIIEYFA